MIQFFDKTGMVGVVISAAGLISLYLFFKHTIYITIVEKGFYTEYRKIENNEIDILGNKRNSKNPIIMVLKDIAGVHIDHSGDLRAEVAYLFNKYFMKTGRALVIIKLVSSISPLLGLMGTMIGMVTMFRSLSLEAANPALLASGIWEALLTTIMGLSVAIPSVCFYYYLGLKIKGIRLDCIEFSYRIVSLIKEKGKVL